VTYRRRASSWTNLWNPELEAEGVRGFVAARTREGTWQPGFSVARGGSWPDFFYESNSWEYSLAVPHDVRALVERSGGKEAFFTRLERLFDGRHWNIGNEPAFFAPVLYHWVGRPDRAVDRARAALARHFRATADGLPGNDDSGAMSAWYVFHALGLYPSAGTDVYLVTSPLFAHAALDLGGGRRLEIVADGVSDENRYVQAATLDGRPLGRAWLRHGEIASGARLVLTMGPRPSAWGTTVLPPSLSDP
jgi:predicted alpha-1,2-mannosidase